jgi:hypothetical protein
MRVATMSIGSGHALIAESANNAAGKIVVFQPANKGMPGETTLAGRRT